MLQQTVAKLSPNPTKSAKFNKDSWHALEADYSENVGCQKYTDCIPNPDKYPETVD